MAGNLNKVFLMGNLTRDVELRYLSEDRAVGNFGIAVNRRFKTRAGELQEETTFVDCEIWGRRAEAMSQYLGKGAPVFIEGRLKLDQWQDRETGGNRSKLRVVVENFEFVGGGAGSQSGGEGASGSAGRPAKPQQAAAGGHEPLDEEDIPF